MKKEYILYIIIAFLIGMLTMDFAHALKVPDTILSQAVDPDLKEMIEDYIIPILNNGRYVMGVSGSLITSTTIMDEGEFMLDDSGVNKYLVVSNGDTNYRVQVTAVP